MDKTRLVALAILAASVAELACVAAGSVECSKVASLVGSTSGGVLISVLAYTLWRGGAGLRLALAMIVAASGAGLLKEVVQEPRPPSEYWLVHVEGPSFPSGHATASSALAVTLSLYTRDPILSIALAFHAVAVGLSRLVLRVHYPVDVVGGFILGGGVAALLNAAWPRLTPRASIALSGAASAVMAAGATIIGGGYTDIGILAGAGLGLLAAAAILGYVEGWERCIDASLSVKGRIAAFAIAALASAPVLRAHTLLSGVAAGALVGVGVPLSRIVSCKYYSPSSRGRAGEPRARASTAPTP